MLKRAHEISKRPTMEGNVLTLRFDSHSKLTLGPSTSFTIEGPFIRQSPDNEIVCRCSQQVWQLADEAASRFECTDRTRVQFEDWQGRTSPLYGPFERLEFENDNCYADDRMFAEFLNGTQRWKHCDSGIRWRILNVFPAVRAQD